MTNCKTYFFLLCKKNIIEIGQIGNQGTKQKNGVNFCLSLTKPRHKFLS
jgi:hypothetical protein